MYNGSLQYWDGIRFTAISVNDEEGTKTLKSKEIKKGCLRVSSQVWALRDRWDLDTKEFGWTEQNEVKTLGRNKPWVPVGQCISGSSTEISA